MNKKKVIIIGLVIFFALTTVFAFSSPLLAVYIKEQNIENPISTKTNITKETDKFLLRMERRFGITVYEFAGKETQAFCIEYRKPPANNGDFYIKQKPCDDIEFHKAIYVIDKHKVDNEDYKAAAQKLVWFIAEKKRLGLKDEIILARIYLTPEGEKYFSILHNDYQTIQDFESYNIYVYEYEHQAEKQQQHIISYEK